MCSKLSATFVPFSVLSLIRPRTIKVASTSRLSFALFTWQKIPGSPRLHNFNFAFPSVGAWERGYFWVSCLKPSLVPRLPPLRAWERGYLKPRLRISTPHHINCVFSCCIIREFRYLSKSEIISSRYVQTIYKYCVLIIQRSWNYAKLNK